MILLAALARLSRRADLDAACSICSIIMQHASYFPVSFSLTSSSDADLEGVQDSRRILHQSRFTAHYFFQKHCCIETRSPMLDVQPVPHTAWCRRPPASLSWTGSERKWLNLWSCETREQSRIPDLDRVDDIEFIIIASGNVHHRNR